MSGTKCFIIINDIPYLSTFCFLFVFQCKKYRSQFTEEKKAIYEEKLEASEIFKDKKTLYPSRYQLSALYSMLEVYQINTQ